MTLLFAIISVFLALGLYGTSIGWEFVKKEITLKIIILFCLGFFFDLTGTILMSLVSSGFSWSFHAVAGLSALGLMGVKAIWSIRNYNQEQKKRVPAIFTILVTSIWIAVFVAGFFVER